MVQSTQYKYSEIFYSIQGEGAYTGVPTAWLRFFACNLQCNGFGQKDPTNPDTYELPYQDYDASKIDVIEDLPVWDKGCDSSYSWSKKFKHLQREGTPDEIADRIIDCIKTDSNPEGLFKHPHSLLDQHMCFTGGEPLMKLSQQASIDIHRSFTERKNYPKYITYETNGTQPLQDSFVDYYMNSFKAGTVEELFFSVSPKLWTVAGELNKRAIKPDVVASYFYSFAKSYNNVNGQLKFVVGDTQEQWDELESHIQAFREAGLDWPIWIMPVGATLEGQEDMGGKVAKIAFEKGYNVSARVHTHLFGNEIGT